ncbi:MAG: gliding motility-associated C-terminal domain-containing protein [Bacteroidota bacterium]|nr:gliding motility-associated C-terminal domain-containing protein [Bacteroidota bacterium]
MKRFFLFIVCFVFAASYLRATHNIAGEITVRCTNTNTNEYEVTIATYTNMQSPADRCDLTIFWGDGPNSSSVANRINGPGQNLCPNATDGFNLTSSGYPFTKQNLYKQTHSYPGPGTYTLYIIDPNRVAGIENIPNSVNVPFYIETVITIDPFIGCNSTPVLTTIPLDKACLNHCFYHNPGAVDPDGDSLAYRIGQCLDTLGNTIPGYLFPNIPGGGTLTIDAVTGDLAWCSPQVAGKYNLVIYIDEWKRFANGQSYLIGTVERDMNIDVSQSCNNENPDISDIPDLCVDAGDTVDFDFTVSDPDASQLAKLLAYGGPFNLTPSAVVTPVNVFQATPYVANFTWITNCDRVRLQPWIVTLKATDNGTPPLSDIESFKITVVSPGPAFLTASPQGSQMILNWGVNPCDPATNFCRGYKIYRRQGPSAWTPAQCETGVPAYTGFVLIGTVTGINSLTFTDNNGGSGLIPGVDYCYRVCAYFNDGAESYASPEACSELRRDVPVITHVDVMTTSTTTGDMSVRWVNAIPNGIDFDTIQYPGPWKLELTRSNGFTYVNPLLVGTFTAPTFGQLDSSMIDNLLNTTASAYTYRLEFFYTDPTNGFTSIGTSQPASSVYLSAVPSDNTVTLSWQYAVPWTNFEYAIYRFNNITSVWDSIALAPASGSYVDSGLQNDIEYCYYITAHGAYFNPTLPPVMYNRSQRICATPHDLTAPCAPNLAVNSDCFLGLNQLNWTNPMNMNCGTDDVVTYHVYYSLVEGDPLILLTTINFSGDTSLTLNNLSSVAACYAVTAIDSFGNESPVSNVICVDNCPEYILPNVFTPNGDGTNDFFIPFPYRYVKDVEVRIYDRWGVLIFQTMDPNIHWDGRDMTTNKLCTDGVYYYTAVVNEIRLEGIVPRELKGFVHLLGKDIGQFQ